MLRSQTAIAGIIKLEDFNIGGLTAFILVDPHKTCGSLKQEIFLTRVRYL
jgi:hypothetical protein